MIDSKDPSKTRHDRPSEADRPSPLDLAHIDHERSLSVELVELFNRVGGWLCLPVLWLSVWGLIAFWLVTDPKPDPAVPAPTLGWWRSLLAVCIWTLFWQTEGWLGADSRRLVFRGLKCGLWLGFAGVLWAAGGWSAVAILVVVGLTASVQRWLQAVTPEMVGLGQPVRGTVPSDGVLGNESREANPSAESGDLRQTASEASPAADGDKGHWFGNAEQASDHQDDASDNEQRGDESCEEECEDECEDGGGMNLPDDWTQYFVRAGAVGGAKTAPEIGSGPQDRIEWFVRYFWEPTEQQADVHLPFQPLFEHMPDVRAEVVEGVGTATLGDVQPYGARIQLKRSADASDSNPYSVVWIQVQAEPGQQDVR